MEGTIQHVEDFSLEVATGPFVCIAERDRGIRENVVRSLLIHYRRRHRGM
jgi:hypothetical protein